MSKPSFYNHQAYEHFSVSKGGTSHVWTKRYKKMIETLKLLEELPNAKEREEFINGYKACVNVFHTDIEKRRS